MSEYIIQGETLTSIGDEVRTLSGTTDTMSPSAMATNVEAANTEITGQSSLISQIISALDGKAAGSGSGGSTITTGVFTHTEEDGNEPETYNYVLTSDALQSSTRNLIIIFTQNTDNYSYVWKVLHRVDLSDSFENYLGSNGHVGYGMSCTITENTITVDSTYITGTILSSFWFIAI